MKKLSNAMTVPNVRWTGFLMATVVTVCAADAGAGYVDYVRSLNPTAYWRLGESSFDSTRTALDASGRGNHGAYHTRVASTALGHTGALHPADSDYAIYDAGGLTTVSLPSSVFFTGSQAFTISLWCRPAAAGFEWQSMFGLGQPVTNGGIAISSRRSGDGRQIVLGRFFNNFLYSNAILGNGTWHHVALRFDGTSAWNLFINGQLDNSSTQPLSVGQPEAWLGEFFGWETVYSYPFHGGLDEAAYFSFPLPDADILKLSDMEAEPIPQPAAVAVWAVALLLTTRAARRPADTSLSENPTCSVGFL